MHPSQRYKLLQDRSSGVPAQALLDAAKLAGLNVMGLIHSHAAAALQVGAVAVAGRCLLYRLELLTFWYNLGAMSANAMEQGAERHDASAAARRAERGAKRSPATLAACARPASPRHASKRACVLAPHLYELAVRH